MTETGICNSLFHKKSKSWSSSISRCKKLKFHECWCIRLLVTALTLTKASCRNVPLTQRWFSLGHYSTSQSLGTPAEVWCSTTFQLGSRSLHQLKLYKKANGAQLKRSWKPKLWLVYWVIVRLNNNPASSKNPQKTGLEIVCVLLARYFAFNDSSSTKTRVWAWS